MIESSLLVWTAIAFAGLVLAALALYLGHAAWATAGLRRFAARRPAALRAVATALRARSAADAELALAPLSGEQRIDVLVDMAFTVAGDQREELSRLARRLGILDQAAAWARTRRWSRRLRAARLLALFGDGGEPQGPRLLGDPSAEVRAEAAEWAAAHPAPAALDGLLEMLDDPEPRCRFAARDGLGRAGRSAVGPLARYLENPPARSTAGALEAARGVAAPELLAPALRLIGSSDPEVRARAATLAAAVGSAGAAGALVALLDDGDRGVRAAAASGLGSLGHWPAAAPLASLLDDQDFAVRRAAGVALLRMGPTGELLLRRAARDPGPRRDVARRVLGMDPDPDPGAEPIGPLAEGPLA